MTQPWWQSPCQPLDNPAMDQARARQQQLTKPAGSLGQLEGLAIQLAGLQGRERPTLDHAAISIFAGDHGVVEEGISAYPQAVTGQMLRNFVGGGAAISVLARQLQASLEVVDLGTIDPHLELPGVRHLRLGAGTANFARQPAMTEGQLQAALQAGQLNGQAFQLAERTGRFGQLLLTGAGLVHGGVVEGLAGVTPPGLSHSAGPLSIRGRPATVSTTR